MADAARGKRILVAAALVGACSLVAVPAYGFYYVHNDELVATESKGAIEIVCTLDETASNGGVKTGVIMVPEGSTVGDCLKEAVVSNENQNGLEAIHDYSVSSLADDLSDKQYTCTVHKAASQAPGTQTTYDSAGTDGEDTVLRALGQRGDHGGVARRRGKGSDDQPAPSLPFPPPSPFALRAAPCAGIAPCVHSAPPSPCASIRPAPVPHSRSPAARASLPAHRLASRFRFRKEAQPIILCV